MDDTELTKAINALAADVAALGAIPETEIPRIARAAQNASDSLARVKRAIKDAK